jgi:cation transport ATPase
VLSLALKLVRREFGSDLLAGISIVAAVLLQEYQAGALVVLMLFGGKALEAFALGRASSVLQALARRMPLVAHRRVNRRVTEVQLAEVRVGDELIVYPHEICPVDGVIIEGHGVMDESYLTGEPFMMPKAPGSEVFSGAINGQNALTLRASRLAVDSRYARIMSVMRDSEQRRPQLRRLMPSTNPPSPNPRTIPARRIEHVSAEATSEIVCRAATTALALTLSTPRFGMRCVHRF